MEKLLKVHVLIILLVFIFVALPAYAQSPSDTPDADSANSGLSSASPTASTPTSRIEAEHPDKRLFGVLPNYRTVEASIPFAPLTPRQKLSIASHDSFDWPTYPLAALMTLLCRAKKRQKDTEQD